MGPPGAHLLIALFSVAAIGVGAVQAQGFQQRPSADDPAQPRFRETPAPPPTGYRSGTSGDETAVQAQETGTEPSEAPTRRSRAGTLMGRELPPPPVMTALSAAGIRDADAEPDELVVVSVDMPEAMQAQQVGQDLGFGIRRRSVLQGLGLVVTVFRLPDGVTPVEALERLHAQAPQLRVDLNHRYTLQGTNEAAQYPARILGWPADPGNCGRGVRIGVVDGPLPDMHPALSRAQLTRESFVTRGMPVPSPGHALAVVAILTDHEHGLVPAAQLYHAQVMRLRDGRHADTLVDWLLSALDWLARQAVDVINLSLGGPRNQVLEAAIGRLLALDIAVVAAAGNHGAGATPVYPAAYDGVIAVTAVDADGRLYPGANRGEYIVFAAPGVDLWLPRMDGHAYLSGTSFAAPHVTAALAAARQAQPVSDWSGPINTLIRGAKDLGEPGRDPLFGWGLVQADTACGA